MTQADSVHSTPPTNTSKIPLADPTRRHLLTVAAGGAVAAAIPAAATTAPAVAGIHPDAELIDLGARFEPLVDQYYVAQRRWSTCSENALRAAGAALGATHEEMARLANAINAAPINSIEGLRTKALVALWEIAPLCRGETEFSFEDAYPFQQLFMAVAQVCGLQDKIAATGCELPDIGIAYDDVDEDCDDEGKDA